MSSPLGPWDLTDPTRLSPSLYESGVTPQVVISPAKSRDRTNSAQNADPAVNGLRRVSPGQALLAIQAVEFRDRDVDQIQEKEPVIADERLLVAIRTATAAEKELAIRVAQAAERLRGWCNEIQKWGWSGSFKMRDETDDEHAREEGINKAGNFDTVLNDNGPFTLTRINLHQTRLDDIQGSLSGLELEDLKDRVLGYYSSRSRPTSSYSHASRTESQLARLELMDDMPLLTTHLLMQCLPDLYSLRSSLDTWSVRLRVLRGLPQFLESLDHATKAMELGWEAIKPVASSGLTDTSITQHAEALTVIKGVLEQKITSLGRKLDDMLDALEGLEDSLPDQWIDDFEDLETEYGRWAVESRNGVLDLQMRLVKQQGQDVEQSSVPDETLSPTDIQHHDMLAGGPAILPDEIAVTQVQDGAKELIESATTQDVNRASSLEQPAASKIHSATDTDQEAADIPASPEPIGESSTRLPEHEPVREPSGDDDGGKADSRPPFPLKRASVTSIGSLPRAQVKSINIRRNSSGSILGMPQHTSSQGASTATSPSALSNGQSRRTSESDPIGGPTTQQEGAPPPAPDRSEEEGAPSNDLRPTEGSRYRAGSISSIASSAASDPVGASFATVEDSPLRQKTDSQAPPLALRINKARQHNEGMRNGSNSNTAISNPSDVASPQASPTETVFSKADLNAQISDILSSVSGNIKLQPVPTSDRISTTPTTPIGPKSNAKVSTINIAKRPPGPRTSGSRSASTPLKPPITPSHLRSGRASPSLMPESGRNSPAPDSEPSSKLRPVGAPSDSHRRPAFRSVSAAPSTLVQVPNASGSSDSDIRLYHLHRPGTSAPPLKLHIRRIGDRVMVRVGGGWADLGAYLQNYIEHHGRRTRVDNAEGSVGGGVGFEVLTSSPKSREPSMAGTPLSKELGTSTEVFPGGGTDDHGSRETTPSVGPQSANSRRSASTPFTSAQEVGLAGPAVKKLELSGEKKEWVEGMVERAKMASLGGEFGSLGNVGGVKRLFRKGLE